MLDNCVNGCTLSWIEIFLTNRSHVSLSRVNFYFYTPMPFGVSQLGYLLMSRMTENISSMKRTFGTLGERLELNPSKLIRVTRKREPKNFPFHCQILGTVENFKCLDDHWSHYLRCNEQVTKQIKFQGFFKRILRITYDQGNSVSNTRILFYSSRLKNCNNVKQAEMVRRKATQLVLRWYDRKDSVEEMLQVLGREFLRQMKKRRTMLPVLTCKLSIACIRRK